MSFLIHAADPGQLTMLRSIEDVERRDALSFDQVSIAGDAGITEPSVSEYTGGVAQGVSQGSIRLSTPIERWSAALEARFGRLAECVAVGEISDSQREEFEQLQGARRRNYL